MILGLARRDGVIGRDLITAAWPDADQGARALTGLVSDGLLVTLDTDRFGLPGVGAGR